MLYNTIINFLFLLDILYINTLYKLYQNKIKKAFNIEAPQMLQVETDWRRNLSQESFYIFII